ncbi:MAG: excinuclease ABC subunit C [Dethiosulfovibrio peptidovorans]|nr:MAG: excinuclease ABC subunit C [Dethiosulfovibrio peptidovorans]
MADRVERLKKLVRTFPNRPGVYLMHDSGGSVIYVGKAKSLKKRVSSYFRHSGFASPRLRKLVSTVEDISTIRTETEAEALIVESRLIKKLRPFFNVDLKINERYPYVHVTDEAFPRLKVSLHKGEGLHIGPFVSAGELRRLLRLIERYFPLRTCAQDLSRVTVKRPCIRHELGKCQAPCAGLCSPGDYRDILDDVLLLLRGQTLDVTERLRRRMDKAAQNLDFEGAARLRDTLRALWRFSRQRVSATLSADLDEDTWQVLVRLQEIVGLATIPWRIDGFDISHSSGHETYGVAVVFEQGLPNPSLYRRFAIRDVEGIDDFRSMRETVTRRYRRCLDGEAPLPQLILIDGGPEQLRFAADALTDLGLAVPIISLAKREELIFTLGSDQPLVLERNDPALRLLQRVRDESHRYAITTHRGKRQERLRRSALEDIPGIGKRRAAALLARFGSVHQISRLSPEELMVVPGIGDKHAENILNYLGGS